MKKIILFAAVVCAATMAQAQHANPLDSLSTNMQIDSMRIQFSNNPVGMVAALQVLQTSLGTDEKMLKNAQKQIKDEQAYAKSLESYLKTATNELNNLKKTFENNRSGLEKMQSTINNQLNALHKVDLADQTYENSMEDKLNGYLSAIHDAIDRANAASRNVDDQLADASRQQTDLGNFKNEIEAKQEQLKNLQDKNKADKEAVKTEMKAWKGLVKKK